MSTDGKEEALADWHKLLKNPKPRMDAEELYDELLHMADRYKSIGLISEDDWKALVEEATAFYAQSREGLEGGT
jgi:hypothetical protein